MHNKNIYQASQFYRKDAFGVYRTVQLDQLSWIFDCPDCPYIMTALTKEGAETLQHTHMISMPDAHLESMAEHLWENSPLSSVSSGPTTHPL